MNASQQHSGVAKAELHKKKPQVLGNKQTIEMTCFVGNALDPSIDKWIISTFSTNNVNPDNLNLDHLSRVITPPFGSYLMARTTNDGREDGAWGVVTGKTGLAHARTIVYYQSGDLFFAHDDDGSGDKVSNVIAVKLKD